MHIPKGTTAQLELVTFQEALTAANTPSDEYDIGKWEYLASKLAIDCGIDTAETKLLKTNQNYSIFLSKRFDRTSEGKRIHMASSLTLLGLRDGCGAESSA